MSVIDCLDKGLDLRALGLASFRHPSGYLGRVSLDASDKSMWERVRLRTGIKGLDYDDLMVLRSA